MASSKINLWGKAPFSGCLYESMLNLELWRARLSGCPAISSLLRSKTGEQHSSLWLFWPSTISQLPKYHAYPWEEFASSDGWRIFQSKPPIFKAQIAQGQSSKQASFGGVTTGNTCHTRWRSLRFSSYLAAPKLFVLPPYHWLFLTTSMSRHLDQSYSYLRHANLRLTTEESLTLTISYLDWMRRPDRSSIHFSPEPFHSHQ